MALPQIVQVSLVVLGMALSVVAVMVFYRRSSKNSRFKSSTESTSPNILETWRSSLPANTDVNSLDLSGVSSNSRWSSLYGMVGRNSKYTGVAFIVVSIALLVLSVYYQFVVLQIDSVIAFVAALVLLFKDPRAKVQARVFDGLLVSTTGVIGELSSSGSGFTYVPSGKSVEDVVVVPNGADSPWSILKSGDGVKKFTPPGRGLATVFAREAGISALTTDGLSANLQRIMCEHFGLAKSLQVDLGQDRVEVTLQGALVNCGCVDDPNQVQGKGSFGCAISSLLAVLYCSATSRSVILEDCAQDDDSGSWKIELKLGSNYLGGNV